MLKNKEYKNTNIVYENIEGMIIPFITCENNDIESIQGLQDVLIDGVFSKNGIGYISNENHLIYFNSNRFVVWVNNRGFIHMVLTSGKYGEHYVIHKTKNTIDPKKDGFWDNKELINSCINVINKNNIYN